MDEAYYQEIAPIVKELGSIFDSLCSKLCPGCAISCCEPCVRENGYYKDGEIDNFKNKYGFNEKTGFLKQRGCAIPRLYRSTRCLYHICLRIQMAVIKEKGAVEFTKLREKIAKLSEQHNKILSKYNLKQLKTEE